MSSKVCGPIKNQKHPNVYSKEELILLAMEKLGFTKNKAIKMTKENLCIALFGKESNPHELPTEIEEFSSKRPCGVRKSSKNPDAYTKDELIDLAMKHLKMSKSEANKSTMKTICERLSKFFHTEPAPSVVEIKGGRPCGPRKNAKNNAYTKDELITLAETHLKMSKSQAKKSTVETLCNLLFKILRKESTEESKISLNSFDMTKCDQYTLEELKALGELFHIDVNTSNRSILYQRIRPMYLLRTWTRILSKSLKELQERAGELNIPQIGGKSELARNIFEHSGFLRENEEFDYSINLYTDFINSYKEFGQDPDIMLNELIDEYTPLISRQFFRKFKELTPFERDAFILLFENNPDSSPSELINTFQSSNINYNKKEPTVIPLKNEKALINWDEEEEEKKLALDSFDMLQCDNYKLSQLANIANEYNIRYNKKKITIKELCQKIIPYARIREWGKMLSYSFEELTDMSKGEYSSNKMILAKNLFKHFGYVSKLDKFNFENPYEKFLKLYDEDNLEYIIINNKQYLSDRFIDFFRNLSHTHRKNFLKFYNEHFDDSLISIMEQYISQDSHSPNTPIVPPLKIFGITIPNDVRIYQSIDLGNIYTYIFNHLKLPCLYNLDEVAEYLQNNPDVIVKDNGFPLCIDDFKNPELITLEAYKVLETLIDTSTVNENELKHILYTGIDNFIKEQGTLKRPKERRSN